MKFPLYILVNKFHNGEKIIAKWIGGDLARKGLLSVILRTTASISKTTCSIAWKKSLQYYLQLSQMSRKKYCLRVFNIKNFIQYINISS